eukprot:994253-Pyramimonas_sp.AAC.2
MAMGTRLVLSVLLLLALSAPACAKKEKPPAAWQHSGAVKDATDAIPDENAQAVFDRIDNLFDSNVTSPNSQDGTPVGSVPVVHGCGDKTTCSGTICLCKTTGADLGYANRLITPFTADAPADLTVNGFLNTLYDQLRLQQTEGGFIQLFLMSLPGTDLSELRKLWEVRAHDIVTGFEAESVLVEEQVGKQLNR